MKPFAFWFLTAAALPPEIRSLIIRLRSLGRPIRVGIVVLLAVAAIAGLCLYPRVPLAIGYHQFADQRVFFGIPHALNVLSNAALLLVGFLGLKFVLGQGARSCGLQSAERWPYLLFFVGAALTGLGSAYYHLQPDNLRLPWDLLPMTMSFVSLLAAIIVERVSRNIGLALLPVFVLWGFASVEFWQLGALRGAGDYKFYIFTQYFPAFEIAVITVLFPPFYTRTRDLLFAFCFYLLAKILEVLDYEIYGRGQLVSGHTLKHLCAGLACYWILRMVRMREPLLQQGSPAGS